MDALDLGSLDKERRNNFLAWAQDSYEEAYKALRGKYPDGVTLHRLEYEGEPFQKEFLGLVADGLIPHLKLLKDLKIDETSVLTFIDSFMYADFIEFLVKKGFMDEDKDLARNYQMFRYFTEVLKEKLLVKMILGGTNESAEIGQGTAEVGKGVAAAIQPRD